MRSVPLHPSRRRRELGFTLVELMLIVLLIGVLAAIALPKYQDYRNRARVAQTIRDMASMGALIQAYWLDNRGYPPGLAAIGRAGALDPWGQPYVYYNIDENGKGHARKDKSLNPINTDYDLYSVGVDGDTHKQVSQKASADDVLRGRNGAFLGLGADF